MQGLGNDECARDSSGNFNLRTDKFLSTRKSRKSSPDGRLRGSFVLQNGRVKREEIERKGKKSSTCVGKPTNFIPGVMWMAGPGRRAGIIAKKFFVKRNSEEQSGRDWCIAADARGTTESTIVVQTGGSVRFSGLFPKPIIADNCRLSRRSLMSKWACRMAN